VGGGSQGRDGTIAGGGRFGGAVQFSKPQLM